MEELGLRPLTARSVLASTLLGTKGHRLSASYLVRTGALFGLTEGAVRTALSRMVSAGDVHTDGDGCYELSAWLAERRARQEQSRAADVVPWTGNWWIGVVEAGPRAAKERATLRVEMERARLAELRDGVWVRPDNLDPALRPDRAVTSSRCWWYLGGLVVDLDQPGRADADLVASLWDLEGWAQRATAMRRAMHDLSDRLEEGDASALAPGFVLSAAVLRHFVADPLLPEELLPRHWPGRNLRGDYERYDAVFRTHLAEWTSEERR